jgi:hypothetical protein
VVNGAPYLFETDSGTTTLKLKSTTTPSNDKDHVELNVPSVWLITRGNGVPLFSLKPKAGDKPFRIMKAELLYAEKIQWFEPLADNYRELEWVNPEASTGGTPSGVAFKQFTWKQIIDFAIVDRPSISFASHLPGDWKRNSEGGDSYLMVMIEGKPYWADAVGQIPFAVDTYRKYFEEQKQKDSAIVTTVKTGIEYGDGNPLMPAADPTNEYDNYMVLRGSMWASENFSLITSKRVVEGFVPRTVDEVVTRFQPTTDARLRNPCDAASVGKYGVWLK